MSKKIEVACINKKCGRKFLAREADRKRGWARSCSKSCAATARERHTGNFEAYMERKERQYLASREE